MPSATARIVVQATPQEKRTLTAKARNLGMSVSELMRSGAAAFDPAPKDLLALARAIWKTLKLVIQMESRIAYLHSLAHGLGQTDAAMGVINASEQKVRRI